MSGHHHHHRREDDEDLAYGKDYSGGQDYGGQHYDDGNRGSGQQQYGQGNRGYSEQQYDQGNRGYGEQQYDEGSRGYGDQYGQGQGGDRGIIGDTFKKFKSKYDQYSAQQRPPGQDYGYGSSSTVNSQNYGTGGSGYGGTPGSQQQSYNQPQTGQPAYPGGPPQQRPGQKPGFADQILGGLIGSVASIGHDVQNIVGGSHGQRPPMGAPPPGGYQPGLQSNLQTVGPTGHTRNRFDSTFYGPKPGNDVKWFVDGCSYMWAVSHALESARQTIWILDWWLSPELYLRRPPARNEEWRLDKVLLRAANRGVKINIIVYKEVTQALTLSSAHTKHALEALSPNIGVFRHPDHLPDAQTTHSSILSSLEGLKLDAEGLSKLGADALKGAYGITDDVILYWAHHEKLCLIDGNIAFMGGLDLCYGRWDTNQHPIADAHPSDLNKIVFPGQDYNNARVMDFSDVSHPFQNKLDRTKSSRMGWSDISISLRGPCVGDLIHHFVDRWNFIYDEKYNVRQDKRYQRLPDYPEHRRDEGPQAIEPQPGQQQGQQAGGFPPPPGQSGNTGYQPPAWQSTSRPSTATSTGAAATAGAATGGIATYGAQGSGSQAGYNQQGGQQTFPPPPPGPPPANQGQYGQPPQQGYQSTPVGQQSTQNQGQYGPSSQQGYQSTLPGQQPPPVQGQYGTTGPQGQYSGTTTQSTPQSGYPRPPASPGPQGQYQSGPQAPPSPQPQYGTTQSQQPYPQNPQLGQGQGQGAYAGSQYQGSYPQPPASPQPGRPSGQYQGSYPQPAVSPQPGQQRPNYPQPSQSPAPSQSPYPGQTPTSNFPPPPAAQQGQGQGQYGGGAPQASSARPHTPSAEANIAAQQYAAYTTGSAPSSQGPPGSQGPIELGSTTSPQYKPYGGQPTARGLDEPGEYESGYSGERGFGDSYDEGRYERGGERGYGGSYDQGQYGYDQGGERAFGSRKPGASPSRFDRYKDEALQKVEGKKFLGQDLGKYGQMIENKIEGRPARAGIRPGSSSGPISAQLVRSCTKWSNGTPTEHSVQNAYIELIKNSRHFIYIENQFFITATGDHQKPVKNMIGAALVERIIRASQERTPFKIIVNIPSVPAFAGDLIDDAALGTRAIMEFQYNSICRGGHSIMEEVAKAGVNPMDYIRFYNLRNYDRINVTPAMLQAQQQTGIGYDDARVQYEAQLGSGYGGYGEAAAPISQPGQPQPQPYAGPLGQQQPYSGQPGQSQYGQQPSYGTQPGQGTARAGPGDQQPGQAGYQPPGQTGQQYGQQGGYNTTQSSSYNPGQSGVYQAPGQQTGYQPPTQQSTYQSGSQTGGYSSSQQGGYQPPGQQSGYGSQQIPPRQHHSHNQYQQAAQKAEHVKADDWDTVSSCYMLGGQDIRNVPWSGPPEAELDAFVSEELYIHTKIMIVDDQTVICGSANLNDRSMLGSHDSEIALVINDSTPVQSTMAGRPWQANRFAASLRRQLFRKHLGLLRPQDMEQPNDNFMPVGVAPNAYDWGTPEDNVVADPLSDAFQSLWNSRARTNTEVFRKAFRAVPDDNVKTWPEYKEFYEYYFKLADEQAVGKDEHKKVSRVEYGHVVRTDFPGGARELKELLSRVKGTLVEMPLCFLQNEDIAKAGISFNPLTAELYT